MRFTVQQKTRTTIRAIRLPFEMAATLTKELFETMTTGEGEGVDEEVQRRLNAG